MIGKKLMRVFVVVLLFVTCFKTFGKVLLSSGEKNVAIGDIISVQIIIEGDTDAEIEKIENIELFNIESQGTSSSFKFINGQSSREKTINYELSLLETTKKEVFLGPVVVRINGQTQKSNYLVFSVGEKKKISANSGSAQTNNVDNYYFLDVQVEKENLFVNQKTLLTLKFYNSVEFAEANLVTPDSKDFWLEQSGKQENSREVINGKAYKVTTIKYFFTPLKEGVISLDGFSIKGLAILPDNQAGSGQRHRQRQRQRLGFGFDSFFEDSFFRNRGKRRRVNIKAPVVDLNVKQLPGKGKEGEKFDGVVGQFKIRELDYPNEISANDSINFSFIVSGDGNLGLLEFYSGKSNFKIYKDKDENVVLPGGDLQEARRISYLLIPQKSGRVKIPEFKAKYFDPHDKLFKELIVGGGGVEVTGQITSTSNSEAKKVVQKSSEEISELRDNPPEITEAHDKIINIPDRKFYFSLVGILNKYSQTILLLSLFFSIFMIIFHSFERSRWKSLFIIQSKTSKVLNNSIKKLKNAPMNAMVIDDILKRLLQNDFNPVRHANLECLRSAGVDQPTVEKLIEIYQVCDDIQFSKTKNKQVFTHAELETIHLVVGQYLNAKREQ